MLDVGVWSTRRRIEPYIIIRLFASAQFQKHLPNLRVQFDHTISAAFGLVEQDQVSEKINAPNLQVQLLALTCAGCDCKWNHGCQMLSVSGALREQQRFLIR